MPYIVSIDKEKCTECNVCTELVDCPGNEELTCIGCGACVLVCPSEARKLVEKPMDKEVSVKIDGSVFRVPEQISVKEALTLTDHRNAVLPEDPSLSTACGIGACWSCTVAVDGVVRPACNIMTREGMSIETELPGDYVPKRRVMFFSGQAGIPQVEAVCFTVGCNFLCAQCNNSFITYNGKAEALTPEQTAHRLTQTMKMIQTNNTLITGGECTLNRLWLLQYIEELKKLNPHPGARFLVDTNGSLLTHDYIDDLADSGVTDISIDLKGLDLDTFRLVSGVKDKSLAERYKETAWEAVRYLAHNFQGRVSLSLTIPYNKKLISLNEVNRMGKKLRKIDPFIATGVVAYNAAFRRKDLALPRFEEMKKAHSTLKGVGLENVFAKTPEGFIQPSGAFFPTQGPY